MHQALPSGTLRLFVRRSYSRLGVLVAAAGLAVACSDSASPVGPTASFTRAGALGHVAGDDFAALANAAVTCVDGTINGDVGTSQSAPTGSFSPTNCAVTGAVHIGDGAARQAYARFLTTYASLAPATGDECTLLSGTLAGVTLAPGTYCFAAAATLTGVLTLDGPANGSWLFLVGTTGTGALTGTNFSIDLASGAEGCNVTWWVAQAATMTTSDFVGTILAGAAITLTGGTYAGNAWSKADLTITGTALDGCARSGAASGSGNGPGSRCNQGVGNGPEGCDPGNSNRRRSTNDENGGSPGTPGRAGER